ncbi:MAG: DUF1653 domain-containing protein [Bacilli bacterium]|nr:DUF1653 domain-containing protein [Bacilli bacterium]MDD4607792.1 DUF1653 domain-containing protein [Bacilli bacterium]
MQEVVPGKRYRHFKGKEYKVLMIAYDCESSDDNLKKVVVYQAEYDDKKVWVRDYDSFASLVDKNKYPDITQEYRFELID